MSHRFFRCRLCGLPHEEDTVVCPIIGITIPRSRSIVPARQAPPPELPVAIEAAPVPAVPRPAPVPASLGPVPPARPAAPAVPRPSPSVPRPSVPPATRELDADEKAARALAAAGARPSRPPGPPGGSIIGSVVGGRYRIQRVLAEGGMGIVYEAVHIELGRHVAIKTLARRLMEDPVAITRFRNEARAAGALGHPNIVEVYDMGALADGVPYLVMEKLEGETLGRRIKNERVLPIHDVVDIMSDVLSALGVAHAHNIVHRDLKPDNVFLSRRLGLKPAVKLLDFGISKAVAVDDDETGLTLTRAGFIMGTPAYMAPEQARGDRGLDGRVDIYAVGVLAYEMLLGKLPYASKHPAALLIELQKTVPPSPRLLRPEIPTWLEAVISKLMARDRRARYQSAGEALMAINMRKTDSAATAAAEAQADSEGEDTARTGPPPDVVGDPDSSQKVQIFSWGRKPSS